MKTAFKFFFLFIVCLAFQACPSPDSADKTHQDSIYQDTMFPKPRAEAELLDI